MTIPHPHRPAAETRPDLDPAALATREFWDERYASHDHVWSGRPNPRLVEHADALPPGAALDMGCGEGADALWLAERGWRVTGSDLSEVALGKAARHAADRGVGDRITWLPIDLATEPLPDRFAGAFDLVTAQYLHLPESAFDRGYAALADAVAPGGLLLIVGHHLAHAELVNPALAHLLFAPDRITGLLATLPGAGFEVLVAEAATRPAVHPGTGQPATFTDTVVLARRG